MIKHSVALRLFFGHLASTRSTRQVLEDYIEQLEARIAELRSIHAKTHDDPGLAYPGLVAEWGQRYYASEIDAVRSLADRLPPRLPVGDDDGCPPSTGSTGESGSAGAEEK